MVQLQPVQRTVCAHKKPALAIPQQAGRCYDEPITNSNQVQNMYWEYQFGTVLCWVFWVDPYWQSSALHWSDSLSMERLWTLTLIKMRNLRPSNGERPTAPTRRQCGIRCVHGCRVERPGCTQSAVRCTVRYIQLVQASASHRTKQITPSGDQALVIALATC